MDKIYCPSCGVEILFDTEGKPYVKDYFNEVFGQKAGEKPKRFLAEDGKWRCASCGEEDALCKC